MSVKNKLIMSFAFICAGILTLFLLVMNNGFKRYSEQTVERALATLGKNTAYNLRTPLFYDDYAQIDSLLRPLILSDYSDYILIRNLVNKRTVFQHDKRDFLSLRPANPDEQPGPLPPAKAFLQLKGETFIEYQFPILLDEVSTPIGTLLIGISNTRLQSNLADLVRFSQLITYSLFFALLGAIYIIASRTVQPLKKLEGLIRRFADGEYGVRSPISSRDEVGALSSNFNLMADKINEQIASIENYSKNLQTMVEERTEKLRLAMEEIKEKDRRLMYAEKLNSLNALVSSIAHEINNPMAIISGNVQLLENRTDNPETHKRLFTIAQAIARISRLINEVNFFSSIRDVTISSFTFGNLLNSVIEKVIPASVTIKTLADLSIRISSNHNLLTITLTQILQNCVDAFYDRQIEGQITIRFALKDRVFSLSIEDNGGGIKEPSKIFEPFYSSSSERKGLGLTFAYHAITALEGEISIQNTALGAIVQISLPQGRL